MAAKTSRDTQNGLQISINIISFTMTNKCLISNEITKHGRWHLWFMFHHDTSSYRHNYEISYHIPHNFLAKFSFQPPKLLTVIIKPIQ